MSLINNEFSKKQAIFTVSDANYAVMALTMFDSVSEYYPESDLFLFLVGKGNVDKIDNNINVIYIHDILDDIDLNQRISYYLQVELATSFRPQCFEHLFSNNYDSAIYLDPDLYIFRRMTEVDKLLEDGASGVVTPHALKTVRSNVAVVGDETFLKCGIFNLGFLALNCTSETLRMLSWWKDKLKWQCVADSRVGLFVDQKWLDLLPTYFDGFEILKSPLYNLAPWNSEHYSVISDLHGKFYIDNFDNPIAFIHFSGVRRAVNHFSYLKEARKFYLKELKKREFMKLGFINYQVVFKPKNINLDKICIFLYKDYVNLTKDTTSNPLEDLGFYNYLISNDNETNLPVYIRKLFDVFPDILIGYVKSNSGLDFDSIIKWMKNGFNYDGVVNLGTMIEIRNAREKSGGFEHLYPGASEENQFFVKSFKEQHSYSPAILAMFYKEMKNNTDKSSGENKISFELDRIEIKKGHVIVCLPKLDDNDCLPELPFLVNKKYSEIWVPNINIQKKIKVSLGIENVAVIPYPVINPEYEVKKLNIPNDKFIVLMSHDFSKDFEQQNPMASIAAFKQAFRENNNVFLVCYLLNVDDSECYESLVSAINTEPKATLIVQDNSDIYYSYLHYAHCLISLHRNSFSGYKSAEALLLGKNIIVTGNNGDCEYINSSNSFLIRDSSDENVIIDAVEILKSIYFNEDVLNSKNRDAARFIQKHFSPSTIGFIMNSRIGELSNSGVNILPIFGSVSLSQKNMTGRANSSLRSLIKKIPYAIRIYRKIKGLDSASSHYSMRTIKSSDQSESIMKILLKNVHRPEYLE
ncbi:glycosyltransferase [Yersinia enterocolitica]|uniref:glycosyltransferase n=1 Tax=Yersinia enterocolitica TaxID=630 RepID=UPI0021AD5193|nr:glycosyltransferase [Yersinia enterocolitica]